MLRMPLHPQPERMRAKLHAFHQAVGGAGSWDERLGNSGDPLVVKAVYHQLIRSRDTFEQGIRIYADKVVLLAEFIMTMLEGAGQLVADVSVKAAAKGNIDNLATAADAEEGELQVACLQGQGDLGGIPFSGDPVDARVGDAVEERGVHIPAAGKEQPIQSGEELKELSNGQVSRDEFGDAAAFLHGAGVDFLVVFKDRAMFSGGDTNEGSWHIRPF